MYPADLSRGYPPGKESGSSVILLLSVLLFGILLLNHLVEALYRLGKAAPSATMTVHPVRMNGLVLGVPQTLSYFDKMQQRITRFVCDNSSISPQG